MYGEIISIWYFHGGIQGTSLNAELCVAEPVQKQRLVSSLVRTVFLTAYG